MRKPTLVLIVDDEPAIRHILSRAVASAGFRVAEAEDGAEALDKMAQVPFDIVITDIEMPEIDGLKLLEQINEKYPNTGVILITGHRGTLPPDDPRRSGADDLITKPFHNHDIIAKLRQIEQSGRIARPAASSRPAPKQSRKTAFKAASGATPSLDKS